MRPGELYSFPLHELLSVWCNQQCQDKRDKVYAFLSLAKEKGSIYPNYTMDVDELFAYVLESINWHVIDRFVMDINRAQRNCHYDHDNHIGQNTLWDVNQFRKWCTILSQSMSLEESNPIVQHAVDKAITQGKQRTFEEYLRVYPDRINMWNNAEDFHAALVFRELAYSPSLSSSPSDV
jgi:hypothetical protein